MKANPPKDSPAKMTCLNGLVCLLTWTLLQTRTRLASQLTIQILAATVEGFIIQYNGLWNVILNYLTYQSRIYQALVIGLPYLLDTKY